MSLTQWLTRSRPTVVWRPVAKADHELGAHPVGGGDQHRLLETLQRYAEKATKGALVREHVRRVGIAHHFLDLGQRPVLSIDIDPGIAVSGHLPLPLFLERSKLSPRARHARGLSFGYYTGAGSPFLIQPHHDADSTLPTLRPAIFDSPRPLRHHASDPGRRSHRHRSGVLLLYRHDPRPRPRGAADHSTGCWRRPSSRRVSATRAFSRNEAGTVLEVGPRMTFTTAWSTNAVSVCQACGVGAVPRIERSRRYLLRTPSPVPRRRRTQFSRPPRSHDRVPLPRPLDTSTPASPRTACARCP